MSAPTELQHKGRRRPPDSPSVTPLAADQPGTIDLPKPRSPTLLRFPVVRQRTGLSRSTVWRLERRGQFPRHVRISANIVAWHEGDVTAWILSRSATPVAEPLTACDDRSRGCRGPARHDTWARPQTDHPRRR